MSAEEHNKEYRDLGTVGNGRWQAFKKQSVRMLYLSCYIGMCIGAGRFLLCSSSGGS